MYKRGDIDRARKQNSPKITSSSNCKVDPDETQELTKPTKAAKTQQKDSTTECHGGDFINGCPFRVGASGTSPHVPATIYFCGAHIQGSDIDHAMSCSRLRGSRSRRNDH
jgi:hypothetical protein